MVTCRPVPSPTIVTTDRIPTRAIDPDALKASIDRLVARQPAAMLLTHFSRVTITDLNGCTAQAGVSLEVSKDRHVWAPNIFSPNGDGKNDFFTIYGKGVAHIRHLRVFDRWGNQVFLAEEIPANVDAAGWDGTFRGNLLTPAVFVWVAEVFFLDGERRTLSGDVTIWE
jgi:gliding motility-associated-like protein